MFCLLLPYLWLLTDSNMEVDGQLNEPIWDEAKVFDDFVVTDPLTLRKPEFASKVLFVARKDGLYFGFINQHPSKLRRHRPMKARDGDLEADRNTVMIDALHQGNSAFEFTVSLSNSIQDGTVVNQNEFSYEWDGNWTHAVYEEGEVWYSEIFIPWSTISSGSTRGKDKRIGVYFSRVVQDSGIRQAFPAISPVRPTFVSEFHNLEIPNFKSSSFDFFPYVNGVFDTLNHDEHESVGFDLFWKPSGNHQIAFTVNPDFGQVEADDLVVNFSAIEVFNSEKRPFFNASKAIFDVRTTHSGKLIHTRRIGSSPDDGLGGTSEITAAGKYTGQFGRWHVGLFSAVEDDVRESKGKDFFASRLTYNWEKVTLGFTGTHTNRPTLDRKSNVGAIDFELRPKKKWVTSGQIITTEIDSFAASDSGFGAWLKSDWQPNDQDAFRLSYSYFDESYDINDLGFMLRNNLSEGILGYSRRKTQFQSDSPFLETRFHVDAYLRQNLSGDKLPYVYELQYIAKMKNTSQWVFAFELEAEGVNDLETRGLNKVIYPDQWKYFVSYETPSKGKLRFYSYLFVEPENLNGYAWVLAPKLTWLPKDDISFGFGTNYRKGNEWLIWQAGNEFGSFRHQTIQVDLNSAWFPSAKQEFRLRFQWVAVDGEGRDAYLALSDGSLNLRQGKPADFIQSYSGLQVRYRYKLGPLTDIFAAYSRGSALFEEGFELGFADHVSEGWQTRTADQFYLKARYKF